MISRDYRIEKVGIILSLAAAHYSHSQAIGAFRALPKRRREGREGVSGEAITSADHCEATIL